MPLRLLLCSLASCFLGLTAAFQKEQALAALAGAPEEVFQKERRWTPRGWFYKRSPGEVAYFDLHIPKAAGCSFARDLHLVLKKGQGFFSKESCFTEDMPLMQQGDRRVAMVREPTAHVYSQFLMCKFNKWAIQVVPAEDRPLLANLSTWLRHFDGGRVAENLKCYHPFNMETRALGGCDGNKGMEPSHRLAGDESLERALRHMDEMFHVGVVEHYQASLCLLFSKARPDEALPGFCNCEDEAAWASFSPTKESHGSPPHSVEDLSPAELSLIEELTRMDRALYQAALRRLRQEAFRLQRRTGIRVLCE